MIGKLTGTVGEQGDDWVILDVGGVGYLVHCTRRTLAQLGTGAAAVLWIETHVREDAIKLFGFASALEKDWFAHLQTVQGVGARVALAILDVLSPSEMDQAVAMQNKAAFARASGVGAKLAARIAAELSDRPRPHPAFTTSMAATSSAYTPPTDSADPDIRREGLSDILLRNDAISALVNLGYDEVRASNAVASAYATFDDDPPVDILIKAALKEMA